MIIKERPEDFVVKEINNFRFQSTGKFKIYSLKKEDADLLDVLADISKKNTIPLKKLSFAGIKDKLGITTQYISTPKDLALLITSGKNYKLSFLGFCDTPVKRGGLIGNNFKITVRGLTNRDLDLARQNAKTVSTIGVPNYFDSQRFGSYVENKFIVKDILKGDISSSLKLYLTHKHEFDVPELAMYKKILNKKWDRLDTVDARNTHGRAIITEYQKNKSWHEAYLKIPALERELFISAYQSYIWNESVKILIKQRVDKSNLYSVHYKAGMLTFFKKLEFRNNQYLPNVFLTVSPTQKLPPYLDKIQGRVLDKEGLTLENFDIKEATTNYFMTVPRYVIVIPKNLEISNTESESGSSKETFSADIAFDLPRGSYATVILKALFEE